MLTAQNGTGAGVDVYDAATAISSDHLNPINPFASCPNEVDRHNLTRSLGADNVQNIGKALDLAAFIEIARPIVVTVVVLRPDGKWGGQDKPGHAQSYQAYQNGLH